MKTEIHKDKYAEIKLTYDDSQEAKEVLFQTVLDFCKKHHAFSGEGIFQSDGPQIEAPGLLSDLAEKVFKFDAEYLD